MLPTARPGARTLLQSPVLEEPGSASAAVVRASLRRSSGHGKNAAAGGPGKATATGDKGTFGYYRGLNNFPYSSYFGGSLL